MKRRITISGRNFLDTIRRGLLGTRQQGNITINHYLVNDKGISADVTEIALPDILIRYSVASLPFDLAVSAKGIDPMVQMHFGLSGYEHSYLNGKAALSIMEGQHNLFFVNSGSEELLVIGRNPRFITFEINFRPDYFSGMLNHTDTSFLLFAERIKTQDSVRLSDHSLPVTFEMRRVIESILKCNLSGHLHEFYLKAKINELIALQLQQFEEGHVSANLVRLHATDVEKLTKIKSDMETTLELSHSLDELAYIYGINTDKLKKGFKQLFGHTVFGYLRHLRLEQARRYLMQNDRTVAEIAVLSGYKNPQHFSKVFKEHFGILPKMSNSK